MSHFIIRSKENKEELGIRFETAEEAKQVAKELAEYEVITKQYEVLEVVTETTATLH